MIAPNCSNTSIATPETTECLETLRPDRVISPTGQIVAFSLIYGALFVLSLVGNTIVCIVILQNRDMRTVTNAFLVNLAVCDITFAIVNIPPLLALEICPTYWMFGEVMCQLVAFCSTATTSASIYTMVAIAIDRRHAITNPLEALMLHTRRRTVFLILFVWLISFTAAIPHILTQTLIPYGDRELYCTEDWDGWGGELGNKIFTVALFAFLFIIPVILIGTSYFRIIATLWKTNTALAEDYNSMQKRKDNQMTSVRTATPGIKKSRSHEPQRSGKNKRKTTLMLLTVVILFLVCMLPFNISSLIAKFLRPKQTEFEVVHSHVFIVLLVSSCAWNPFVYNFFSQKFNRAFRRVFKCQCEMRAGEHECSTTAL